MRITLDDDARRWLEETRDEWKAFADEYYKDILAFEGWKRSPILRENRRESIVYGNCAQMLRMILNVANDPELFNSEEKTDE